MMYTKLQKVAMILGVDLGIPFRIVGFNCDFYLTSPDGLVSSDIDMQERLNDIFTGLFTGVYKIKRPLWMASLYQSYYVPNPVTPRHYSRIFRDSCLEDSHKYLYNNGLMCKTESEAQELADIMLDAVKKYREENQ